jgi:hypothetical protein
MYITFLVGGINNYLQKKPELACPSHQTYV